MSASASGTPKKSIAKKTRKVKQPCVKKLTKKQQKQQQREESERRALHENERCEFHEIADESSARRETRSLLAKALRRPDGSALEHEVDARAMAESIEAALFTRHNECAAATYDAQLFSLLLNLSSVKNAALRDSLLSVQLSAKDLVEMRTEDLANPELVKSRFDAAEWAKTVSMARSLNAGEPTRAYTCGKCGKNECRSVNLQIRSADEGFTTFVTCGSCGHRWRN